MNSFDKYILVVNKLRKRYTKPGGVLVVSTGGKPSNYSLYETAAAVKYLGCLRDKLASPSRGINNG